MARKLSVITLVLILLYALAGFVILPWWLERALPDRLARHMGWQATIEEVQINPFAMSIQASGLAADDSDGRPVLAFDRLYLNLGALRLVTGVVAVQDMELDQPFARLDLQDDYSVNFASDWQANNPSVDAAQDAPDKTSDPLKLFLDRLRVAGGEVLFRDFSQSEPEEFRISPLDLALNDLATWPREDRESSYYLMAAIGSQTVEWEGELSVAPLYSSGHLRVADVSQSTLSHFLRPHLPYVLRDGKLTVSSNYQLRFAEQLSLTTSEGQVTLEDLVLALEADSESELLRAGRMHIPGVEFSLIGRELSSGLVAVENLRLGLERNSEGLLNLLGPFQQAESHDGNGEDQPESTAGGRPFRWSLAGVDLQDGQINWLDNRPGRAVDLTVEDLDLTIGRLSHELAEPVDYDAGLALADGGRLNLRGQTTLQPFTLEAGISVSDLNLVGFSPYLEEVTGLTLKDGLMGLDGNLNLDNQQAPLTGTFSGTGEISALDARFAESDGPVLAWQNLRLEPLEYNLSPARLEIGTLTLANPNVRVVREPGGLHNLARLFPATESAPSSDSESDASDGSDEGSAGFIFRIGRILLDNGEVSYTDETLAPVFSTRLDRLNGSLTGLSNVAPQQGKVTMQGRVGDVASLKVDGAIGALGTDDLSTMALKLDDLSLPALSPYLGRYLGYGIESGKLDLDLDYEIAGTQIDAANHILLDRMALGETIASEQAVNAPVKLGLALLRDSSGVIDINLPIAGDLADPQFSIAPVVMRTFVNLVARAATSPFSILGSLADLTGLTGEDLGYVSFQPGRVAVAPDNREKLEALSSALGKRPSLLLKVRGAVSPAADGQVLRRQRLAEQLSISDTSSAADRLSRLESRYQTGAFEQPLTAFRQQIADAEGVETDSLSEQSWERALVNRLVSDVELPSGMLADLARSRGVWLAQALREDYEVADNQLFLLEPLQDATPDETGAVKVNFELEAR